MLATKQEIKPYPTRTNQIPRHIPPPHWASHPAVLFLAAGLLPYGTIFVELYFAMTSIWQVSPLGCTSSLAAHTSRFAAACCGAVACGKLMLTLTLTLMLLGRATSTTSLGSASWWVPLLC